MKKYILLSALGIILSLSTSFAGKQKYCVVFFDETKAKTDQTYSKSVVSNVLKVREGDFMKVKQEFSKNWKLKYETQALDTNLIEVIWHDSKKGAKQKQRELIETVKHNPEAHLLKFNFEFEYNFGFEFGKQE